MNEQQLLAIERRFWTDGPDFYRAHLAPDALMVFAPPAGTLQGQDIVEAVAAAPRWADVTIDHPTWLTLPGDTILVTYRATGRRDGADPYVTLATSIYIRDRDNFKLVFHQQSPPPHKTSVPPEL